MKPAESREVVEFRPSLSAEPVPQTRATTPVVDVPPDVVEHVQLDFATEYAAPAPAVSDAALAPVLDYIAPAPSRGGDSLGVS